MIATVPSTVARPPERGRTKDHPQNSNRGASGRRAAGIGLAREVLRCVRPTRSRLLFPRSFGRGRGPVRHLVGLRFATPAGKKQPTRSVTNKNQRGSLIGLPTLYIMPMKGITVLGHKGMVAYLAGPRVRPKEPAGLMKGPHDEACRAATSDEVRVARCRHPLESAFSAQSSA
jgi:hypothetical protein